PATFSCALLNSWPMGFYAPAPIVYDARRHALEVRPLDVTRSRWDCTLEPAAPSLAIRIGYRYVRGLAAKHQERLEAAGGDFASFDDFAARTRLPREALAR